MFNVSIDFGIYTVDVLNLKDIKNTNCYRYKVSNDQSIDGYHQLIYDKFMNNFKDGLDGDYTDMVKNDPHNHQETWMLPSTSRKRNENEFFTEFYKDSLKDVKTKLEGYGQMNAEVIISEYFDSKEKETLVKLVKNAGFNISCVLNKSQKIAKSFYLEQPLEIFRHYLIFFWGSVICEIAIGKAGNNELTVLPKVVGFANMAGNYIDYLIAKRVIQDLKHTYAHAEELKYPSKNLLKECKRAKETVSVNNSAIISVELQKARVQYKLNNNKFNQVLAPLLQFIIEQIEKCLTINQINQKDIADVKLCGGSTKIPKLQEDICDFFQRPNEIFNASENCTADIFEKNILFLSPLSGQNHIPTEILPPSSTNVTANIETTANQTVKSESIQHRIKSEEYLIGDKIKCFYASLKPIGNNSEDGSQVVACEKSETEVVQSNIHETQQKPPITVVVNRFSQHIINNKGPLEDLETESLSKSSTEHNLEEIESSTQLKQMQYNSETDTQVVDEFNETDLVQSNVYETQQKHHITVMENQPSQHVINNEGRIIENEWLPKSRNEHNLEEIKSTQSFKQMQNSLETDTQVIDEFNEFNKTTFQSQVLEVSQSQLSMEKNEKGNTLYTINDEEGVNNLEIKTSETKNDMNKPFADASKFQTPKEISNLSVSPEVEPNADINRHEENSVKTVILRKRRNNSYVHRSFSDISESHTPKEIWQLSVSPKLELNADKSQHQENCVESYPVTLRNNNNLHIHENVQNRHSSYEIGNTDFKNIDRAKEIASTSIQNNDEEKEVITPINVKEIAKQFQKRASYAENTEPVVRDKYSPELEF